MQVTAASKRHNDVYFSARTLQFSNRECISSTPEPEPRSRFPFLPPQFERVVHRAMPARGEVNIAPARTIVYCLPMMIAMWAGSRSDRIVLASGQSSLPGLQNFKQIFHEGPIFLMLLPNVSRLAALQAFAASRLVSMLSRYCQGSDNLEKRSRWHPGMPPTLPDYVPAACTTQKNTSPKNATPNAAALSQNCAVTAIHTSTHLFQ